MAKHKKQEHLLARVLYTETTTNKLDIAQQIGVQERTLDAWINEGGWHSIRMANASAPKQITSRLYKSINDILSLAEMEHRPLDRGEIEDVSKLTKAIQAQNRSYDFTMYVTVVTELLRYAKGEADAAFLSALHRVQSGFLELAAKRLSS